MSEGYADRNALVAEESNRYDRGLDSAIALSVVEFTLGMLTLGKVVALDTSGAALGELFLTMLAVAVGGVGLVGLFSYTNVVPVTSRRVRGIALGALVSLVGLTVVTYAVDMTLATALGLMLLVQAVAVATAGVTSRLELVDTEPNATAGLLAGVVFGIVGLFLGAALGGTLVGFDSPAWVAVALGGGVGLLVLAVVPREDLGSTLPAAVIVGVLGLTVTTATIGLGWEWNPEAINGGFTGGTVIPLFALFGSLLGSWAAAKSRAGFGARGRQFGAFFVINLNAFLMVAVMVSIVLFVTVKGVGYAFHGFAIGAPSALVLLAPLLVLALNRARAPAGSDEWHGGARQFFRVLPLAAIGSLAALLLSVVLTGDAVEFPFTYTVLVNREQVVLDTAVSVTPTAKVGTLLVLVAGLLLFVYLLRKYGSLRNVGGDIDRLAPVRTAVPLAVAALAVLNVAFVVLGKQPFGLPLADTLGLAAVVVSTLGAGALALLPLAGTLAGDGSMAETARERAQLFPVGVFGGLALLAAVVFLEPTAGVNPVVGPANLVPMVAMAAAGVSLVTAVALTLARRSAEKSLTGRILGDQIVLALAATVGFVVLMALHVALTGADFTLGGVTIGTTGTLSWPMTMSPYIPLGEVPGGILPAVVGTVWLVIGASLFAIPLGVGAAVFLTEYAEQGKFTSVVEVATNALWSTPSVVFGLFGAAFLIPRLGGDESLIAGQLVLGFMLLPLVLITSREAILAVPDEYRDASAALGVDQWQTVRSVVLPAAMPGVITGVILGVGRIAGETAPLILVLGSTLNATEAIDVLGGFRILDQPPFIVNDALTQASASLPTQVWGVIGAGVSGSQSMGWASAFILLMVVLSFYAVGIIARKYFRRKLDYE
ncbi:MULTISPECIES: phosphate ABC transporter permease PstA [Salinibaculum]|uniref:phosphate ABC transporter permease PstA n=1 Tax=Salinibaculum TaxID=2732368 RepID=UPI0030D10FC1